MRVLVSGSHGLIGSALVAALLADGHDVGRLVRAPAGSGDVMWSPDAGRLDPAALGGVDAVVHLAGEPIGEKRWTADQKQRILSSRVTSTDLLSRCLAESPTPPSVLVSGSAIGYYGDRGDEVLDEDSGPGTGFLAEVCQQWEAATQPAEKAGIRVVHARTGIVLSPEGGMLKRLLPLFRVGTGGKLGSGHQFQSWIALDDEVGGIAHALRTATVSGPLNLTAPHPVPNAEFTKTLGRVLGRPTVVAVPKFGLSARMGHEMVEDMLLASQRVVPHRLQESGYPFRHPDLEPALRALLDRAG